MLLSWAKLPSDVSKRIVSLVLSRCDAGRHSSVSSVPFAIRAQHCSEDHRLPTTLGARQYEACLPTFSDFVSPNASSSNCWLWCPPAFKAQLLTTFCWTSSEFLIYRLFDVFTRLKPVVSSFSHRNSLIIVYFRSQPLTCGMLFLTNPLHFRPNFPASTLKVLVSLVWSLVSLQDNLIAMFINIM